MLFSTPIFLFFFLPISLLLYFCARTMTIKNVVLLALSILFYAWGEPVMVLLILASIGFNYLAALYLDRQTGAARKIVLTTAIAVNLANLVVFKYANFLGEALFSGLGFLNLSWQPTNLTLPLGISFYTFHCLSYLIDVYRQKFPANPKLREVALYITFFPQMIAGPIVRYKRIARQLHRRRHSWGRASAGFRLLIIGLAMKVLIADQVAPLADVVFDQGAKPGLIEAWSGALAFAFQIYFDFAGYSIMAIGLGLMFGFALPRNFNFPYKAQSITDFWRRWHISLSSWFRDYLYIPLGGNRGSRFQTYRNLLIVFLLCGLWHGASWTFVLWGLYHGVFLCLERLGLRRFTEGLNPIVSWAYAFIVIVAGWVLFRAASVQQALDIWAGMAGLNGTAINITDFRFVATPALAALMLVAAGVALIKPRRRKRKALQSLDGSVMPEPSGTERAVPRVTGVFGSVGLVVLLLLSVFLISANTYSPFLYFRF